MADITENDVLAEQPEVDELITQGDEQPEEIETEEQPAAELRPLTDTERFQQARAVYAFRYRQAARLLRESGDQMADHANNMNNLRNNQQLMEATNEAMLMLCSIVDIVNRLNCGILEYQPKQESGIQVVGR